MLQASQAVSRRIWASVPQVRIALVNPHARLTSNTQPLAPRSGHAIATQPEVRSPATCLISSASRMRLWAGVPERVRVARGMPHERRWDDWTAKRQGNWRGNGVGCLLCCDGGVSAAIRTCSCRRSIAVPSDEMRRESGCCEVPTNCWPATGHQKGEKGENPGRAPPHI